ncbi:MAG: adenylate/guanylate cyclase domain-containing protein [Pirellulales bacterium]
MSSQIASIGHELRSPLNHILGYSEILIEDAEAAGLTKILSDLRAIHSAGQRLLAVIETILAPSVLSVAAVAPETIDREVRDPLDQIIGYTELVAEEATDLGEATLAADVGKIRQAAERLLAVVAKRVVARRQPVDATPPPIEMGPVSASEPGAILVVDDSSTNREILSRRLLQLGHQVGFAADGIECLEQVRAKPYDLILLDIWMPRLDGMGVLEQLKADPRLRGIPVIVLSADDEPQNVVRCIALGADDHLRKPCDPIFLRTRINASLEKKRLRDREQAYIDRIEQEKKRSEELLHVILPPDVAAELKNNNRVLPRRFDDVGVLFCDVVGFTAFADQATPEELLIHLQTMVEVQELASQHHSLEKIKTIGDAFMAAAGLGADVDVDPALACVRAGLEMVAAVARVPPHWQVRVGIHCGPVFAGVVGHRKYQYDIWGDTVNTASRIEQAGAAGCVCVSQSTWQRIADACEGESLGVVNLKGKAPMEIFRITRLKEGRDPGAGLRCA